MDKIFIQTHIIGQENIFLLIWIRYYKWQPLTARLRTGETESPTWASTTSILHNFDSKLTSKGQAWEEHKSAPKGQRDADSSIKFWQQWTIVSMLNSFSCFQCTKRVPYIAFQRDIEASNPCDLKAYGRPWVIWVRSKSRNAPKGFGLFTHPNVRDYRGNIRVCMRLLGKNCVYHFSYVFRDDQGHIKRQKVVHRG